MRAAAKSWESECAMQSTNQKMQKANKDNKYKLQISKYKYMLQNTNTDDKSTKTCESECEGSVACDERRLYIHK